MDKQFSDHLRDLEQRAYAHGKYTYTAFLDLEEQTELAKIKLTLRPFSLFGGADGCERKIAAFGNENEMGYPPAFPVSLVKVSPLNQKFSDDLNHRDFLGSVMNLKLERFQIGDIIVRQNSAYIFCLPQAAAIITQELTRVKHTTVVSELARELPEGSLYTLTPQTVIVASLRLDCIVGAVYHLSRSRCDTLFETKKIFVNGAEILSTSFHPQPGDIVSVRGVGRFRLNGIFGNTKKGRTVLELSLFS